MTAGLRVGSMFTGVGALDMAARSQRTSRPLGALRRVLSPAFVEWMMGLPAGHVTDVPGIVRRDALRLLGNGVVPQQAEAAFSHLLPLLLADDHEVAA